MASRLTAATSLAKVFFQLLQYSRQRPSFSTHRVGSISPLPRVWSTLLEKRVRGRSAGSFPDERLVIEPSHRAALMRKTDLILPALSPRFVDFAVYFCFCCKSSFHEEWRSSQGLTVVWFSWTNQNSLLRMVTNEITSFYIRTSVTLVFRLVCHFVVLTTFWRHLWSITEQTHGNMDSIC